MWAAELMKHGMDFDFGYRRSTDTPLTISSIKPNWTAEQWVDLMSKDGEWLPACCAHISAMRDIIFGAMREGGWLNAEEVITLIDLMHHHDGFDVMFKDDYDLEAALSGSTGNEGAPPDPWSQLVAVWPHIKDHMEKRDLDQCDDITDIEGAIVILSRGVRLLDFAPLFQGQARQYTKEHFPHKDEEWLAARRAKENWRDCVQQTSTLLTLLPALHTVWHQIESLYPDTKLEEVAAIVTQKWVWDEDEDGKRYKKNIYQTDRWGHGILLTASGPAMYRNVEDADKAVEVWESRDPDIRSKIKLVSFTASVADGITLVEAP